MRCKKNIILTLEILISFLRNLIDHFTGKQKIITLSFIILILSLVSIINTSALNYESNVGVGFTFNPTLSINISSSGLIINNLTPGTASDSNVINVSVASNASYGYTLSAIVNGNNSDLVHTNNSINNTNNIFSSIATNADLSSLDNSKDTNIWGYSYKDNTIVSPSWSNYNGLSSNNSTILLNTNSNNSNVKANGIDSIDFKIAAKAASTQASGTYTGTINFTAVTKHIPITLAEAYASEGKTMINGFYTMQDMTSTICSKVEAIGAQLQVLDKRDNKLYWISKLADDHCWMTQNLDLDLSHDRILTSEDTNLIDNTSLAYRDGYSTNDEKVISWRPTNTTYNFDNKTGTKWSANSNTAYSSDPGEWYWDGDDDSQNCSYPTTECNNFSRTPFPTIGAHGNVGNYYNWSATIASNDSSSFSTSTSNNSDNDPQNSICPRNWRLPTTSKPIDEFYKLNSLYHTNGDISLISSPLYFVRSGWIEWGSIGYAGGYGHYWSSTVLSADTAGNLTFTSNGINSAPNNVRKYGRSVRCVAK